MFHKLAPGGLKVYDDMEEEGNYVEPIITFLWTKDYQETRYLCM